MIQMAYFFLLEVLVMDNYKGLVSKFPVETSRSKLPHIPQDILPVLNYPSPNCLTREKSQNVKAYFKTANNKLCLIRKSRFNFFNLRWYGRRNGFAPSTSRYINTLFNEFGPEQSLLLATARFITPSYSSLKLYAKISVQDEPRLFNPTWLTEINLYQRRQSSDLYPGNLVREVECEWIDN